MEDQRLEYRTDPNGWLDVFHEDSITRTFILLVQAVRQIAKYGNAVFNRKFGLSDVKFIILIALSQRPGLVATASEIAQWTQTEPHNITTLVRRLKRDGLVGAERNQKDRRFMSVTLTDKGREVLKQSFPVSQEIVSQVMSSISQADSIQLEKYLRILRSNAYRAMNSITKSGASSQRRSRMNRKSGNTGPRGS